VAHHSQVEDAARLSDGVRIAGRVSIGERTFIGLGVTVNEKISIGRETVIVSGVHILNHVPDDAIVRIDGKVYARRT
jgi:UDP-perosamine 4-acetyltransferase